MIRIMERIQDVLLHEDSGVSRSGHGASLGLVGSNMDVCESLVQAI